MSMITSKNKSGEVDKIIINAESSSTPWHLSIPVSGSKTGSQNVEIDNSRVNFIWSIYKNNISVSTAIDQFFTNIIKSGFEVKVSVGGKTFEFNKTNKEAIDYISQELEPQIEKVLRDWMLFGYSRVRIVPSKIRPGWPSFNVIRFNTTKEYFSWDEFGWRHYDIKYTASSNSQFAGHSVPGGRILIMHEPDDNGELMSPVSRAVSKLAYLERLWMYYMRSSHRRSKPVHIFTPDPNVSKNLEMAGPMPQIRNAESIVRSSSSSLQNRSSRINNVERKNYIESLKKINEKLAKKVTVEISNKRSIALDNDINIPKEIKTYENELPWNYGFNTPVGHRLNNAPQSTPPDHFIEVKNMITQEIWQQIGMPPEMSTGIVGSSNRVSGNIDHIHKFLRDNIHRFQIKAVSLLEQFLTEVWEGLINKKIFEDALESKMASNVDFLKNQKKKSKVEVKFNYNPIISYETLHNLYVNGALAPDAYQKYALQLSGIPISDKLQNMEQSLVQRAKLMSEATASGKNQQQKENSNNNNGNNNNSNNNNSNNNSNNNNNSINEKNKKRDRTSNNDQNSDKLSKKQKTTK